MTWTPADWAAHPQVVASCHARQMGWDVTDFGSGDFRRRSLLLICTRNGRLNTPGEVPYAEKLLVIGEGQVTPLHTHRRKTEDIINRGGDVLVVELANLDPATRKPLDTPVTVLTDGRARTVQAGEVSAVNDDLTDHLFLDPVGRFPAILEDEPILHPLWSDLDPLT